MAKKKISEKKPVISTEGAAAAPAPAKAPAEITWAPRASANAATHRHKKDYAAGVQEPAPVAIGEAAAPEIPVGAEPVAALTHEEIALRAHLLAEARGFAGGSPEHDWFTAEHQLRAERAAR